MPAIAALGEADDTLATLARFFVLGLPVPRESLAEALPDFGVKAVVRAQFAAEVGGEIAPLVELAAHDFVDPTGVSSWWIVADLGQVGRRGELPPAHVVGVGGASRTLAGLMIHTHVDSTLDLGTGSGILALLASRFSERVVATDISARALNFARFNAELNGATNIEFRLGNLFEPLAGERFDRILSNPPFVITPRSAAGVPAYDYRDGGRVGDGLTEAIVAAIPAHLSPRGIAQLLGNWETRDGVDGLERVRAWTDDAGLDAWVIERERQDPSRYAETWIRDGGAVAGERFDELHGEWIADFAERNVVSIGFGFLTLRPPTPGSSARVEQLTGPLGHNPLGLGAHLADCLAATAAESRLSDDQLGSSRLVVAADVTEERHYWPGTEHPTVMSLRQGGGFGRTVPLDTALAGLVGACDGELTIYAIIAALAELLEADEAELADELLPRIRDLVVVGFLHFADRAG